MRNATIVGGTFVTAIVLLALTAGYFAFQRHFGPGTGSPPAAALTATPQEAHSSCIYGRITTLDGETYEGRLRWGGDEEALWSHYFNGAKTENSWVAHVPPELLPMERNPIAIFGLEIIQREQPIDLRRLFMARFGDIARIQAEGREVRVTLKSGTLFVLDRFEASDFDDGVRVWEAGRSPVDLDSAWIRDIEFLPGPHLGAVFHQLHGTVRTRQGKFTGFVQWNRRHSLSTDELHGNSADGKLSLRFDNIRSIARRSRDSSLVTLLDGRTIEYSGTHEVGQDNLGVYVDDLRYGRVLVSWEAFERIDFSPAGSGPGYDEFPHGGPLTGAITTLDGRHLAGWLVYDLDESEVTETLDAPSLGVDYTIPFGLVASIVLKEVDERDVQHAKLTLHSGEVLDLERTGDLGERNAGMLVFVNSHQRPEYVPWANVLEVNLHQPPAMYPLVDMHNIPGVHRTAPRAGEPRAAGRAQ